MNPLEWLREDLRRETSREAEPPRCPACGAVTGATGEPPAAADDRTPTDRPTLGKFDLIRQLGRGGMGVVYEALGRDLNRRVALKVVKEGEASPVLIERLHLEASTTAQLRHPHIASIHEVGSVPGGPNAAATHFIAMEYVEGRTLAEEAPKLNDTERIRALEVIARTVGYAHQRGVVHRDLKPQNVLVRRDHERISGSLAAWIEAPSFTTGRNRHAAVVYGGRLYVIAGQNAAQNSLDDIQVSTIDETNGAPGTWNFLTTLPVGRFEHAAVAYNGRLYKMGGIGGNGTTTRFDAVMFSVINADGRLGAWTPATPLPSGRAYLQGAAYDGYLYAIGGDDASITSTGTTDVRFASIDEEGELGAWKPTTPLAIPRRLHASVAYRGRLYVLGNFQVPLDPPDAG
ncbi:MAG: protein kinase [Planctomycetes bacterium]|nr:protein kinase [Planctomycetota bacterium]